VLACCNMCGQVADRTKHPQTATNEPPVESEVRKWLSKAVVNPNELDQPMLPPRDLTMNEKLEATTIIQLDRGKEKRKRLAEALEAIEAK